MTQIKAASTIQELKKRADVDQPAESGGEVDVYKFRSIFSQENFYTFHRIRIRKTRSIPPNRNLAHTIHSNYIA